MEMVEKKFKHRNSYQTVQSILEPGRTAQIAKHSNASGRHAVNQTGLPLRALSTFVTIPGSHAYRPGQQSMIISAKVCGTTPLRSNATVPWIFWTTLPMCPQLSMKQTCDDWAMFKSNRSTVTEVTFGLGKSSLMSVLAVGVM